MESTDQFSDFIQAVEALRDDSPVRTTAHTSNASANGWNNATETKEPVTAADAQ